MAYSSEFIKLAQSVHLAVKNRYYDDINGTDGQVYLSQVVDWANQLIDELENTTDQAGNVVQWKFGRSTSYELGIVVEGDTSLTVPARVDSIVSVPARNALIMVDDEIVSKWEVVDIDQIKNSGYQNDRVALVDGELYFSRPINSREDGGEVVADVFLSLPRIDEPSNEFSAISMIKPRQLLVLGIAKNSSLPDLVRGGLSPSFLQRYQALLSSAIVKNSYTSVGDQMGRDDMSYIRGVGF